MLAASARKAGFLPLVIDRFADQDTRQMSGACYAVKRLEASEIRPRIEFLRARYGRFDAVYGSGLEVYPDSLQHLQAHLTVWGNSFETFLRLLDKPDFFDVLEHLHIRYPEVCFERSPATVSGLFKPLAGEGGQGIVRASMDSGPDNGYYWQRLIRGQAMSVLFLANGSSAHIIGINRQWTLPENYLFSGVMNWTALPDSCRQELHGWVERLTLTFSLKGLNSLDFVWDGNRIWLLEINPRPSASLSLYDRYYARGLLAEHIRACQGHLALSPLYRKRQVSAYRIFYAPKRLRIPDAVQWPAWVMDRPDAGTVIQENEPVCSLFASAKGPEPVLRKLHIQEQILLTLLEGK